MRRKKILSSRLIILTILFIFVTSNTFAINKIVTIDNYPDTTKIKKRKYIGTLSGSFETNTTYYIDNKKDETNSSDYKYGSNNYFKLDYVYKGFSAGVQGEWYPQTLLGYDIGYSGFALPVKYVAWQNNDISVTIGDFYEQFGEGLILRAWEDRALGFNNSLGGARITYNIKDIVKIKALSGYARDYMGYSSTLVSGIDISVSLSDIFKIDNHLLSLETSVVNKYERAFKTSYSPDIYEELYGFIVPKSILSYSARFNYQYNSISAKYEYVRKGEDLFTSLSGIEAVRAGQAHLVELGYSANGLSTSATLRYLDNMESAIYKTFGEVFMSNTINYIPSMTTQHTYSLASMKPYIPLNGGEMGGQIDIFYRVRKKTALGGKRGMKVHANYSMYYGIGSATGTGETMFMYSDLTFDIEKEWSRKFKTVFFISLQENSLSAYVPDMIKRNIFVVDMTYKFTNKYSLRAELQHLSTQNSEDEDWVAAQLEFNIAPRWGIYISDMLNYNNQNEHYATGGFSYTNSSLRASLSYGNYKEGYICSGGVCRTVPAYNGVNLAVTIAF